MIPFLYRLETSKNPKLSDVFMGIEREQPKYVNIVKSNDVLSKNSLTFVEVPAAKSLI